MAVQTILRRISKDIKAETDTVKIRKKFVTFLSVIEIARTVPQSSCRLGAHSSLGCNFTKTMYELHSFSINWSSKLLFCDPTKTKKYG